MCYCMWCAALVLLDVVGSGCGALRCKVRALLASYALKHGSDSLKNKQLSLKNLLYGQSLVHFT